MSRTVVAVGWGEQLGTLLAGVSLVSTFGAGTGGREETPRSSTWIPFSVEA